MFDRLTPHAALDATRTLATSAMPDAPVVRDRPPRTGIRIRLRRAAG